MTPPRPAGRLRRAAGALSADLTPLRDSPTFRGLWAAETVSSLGTQMTFVAVPLQVYALSRSSLQVGLVGLVGLVPLVLLGLLGGAIADAVDRRRLVLLTTAGLALCSLAFAVVTLTGVASVPVLLVLTALQAGCSAVDSPTRRTFPARLLRRDQIPAAGSLEQVGFNLALTVGPLLAGLLVGTAGSQAVYLLDTVTFAATAWAVVRLPAMPPLGGATRSGLRSVAEGLRYLRTQRALGASFAADIVAMVFGMPRALFPALAAAQFAGGARTAGLLYAAPAVGALVSGATGGWISRVQRHGTAVLLSVVVWGAAIAAFGLTTALWLGLVLLAVAGAADMVSAVFRNAIVQAVTPDALRGRLSGIFIVVVAGGPRLGDLESGGVASLFDPRVSVVSGGIACLVAVAAVAVFMPSLRRYRADVVPVGPDAPGPAAAAMRPEPRVLDGPAGRPIADDVSPPGGDGSLREPAGGTT